MDCGDLICDPVFNKHPYLSYRAYTGAVILPPNKPSLDFPPSKEGAEIFYEALLIEHALQLSHGQNLFSATVSYPILTLYPNATEVAKEASSAAPGCMPACAEFM